MQAQIGEYETPEAMRLGDGRSGRGGFLCANPGSTVSYCIAPGSGDANCDLTGLTAGGCDVGSSATLCLGNGNGATSECTATGDGAAACSPSGSSA